MEEGGTAAGLPGPEALEAEWSSSSSEESPVYATKPVFNLFTEGSGRKKRGGATAGKRGEKQHVWREREGEKNTQKQQQQHVPIRQMQVNYIQKTFWGKQMVNSSNHSLSAE